EARAVQRELAVAGRDEIVDLLVRLALGQQAPDLAPEVGGEERVRILDALVQALQAAHLRDDALVARLELRVVEALAVDREGRGREKRHEAHQDPGHVTCLPARSAARSRAAIRLR